MPNKRKRSQHIVPKEHLARFSVENKISCFDTSGKTYQSTPKKECCINNYYDSDPYSVYSTEESLKHMERVYQPSIDRICNRTANLDDCRNGVSYVSMLWSRSPIKRKSAKDLIGDHAREAQYFAIELSPFAFAGSVIQKYNSFCIRSNHNKFVLSDNPVIYCNLTWISPEPHDHNPYYHKYFVWFCPLSPNLVFFVCDNQNLVAVMDLVKALKQNELFIPWINQLSTQYCMEKTYYVEKPDYIADNIGKLQRPPMIEDAAKEMREERRFSRN